MSVENEIREIFDRIEILNEFDNDKIIKAIVKYVQQVVKEKDGELDEFAMNKAADVKFKTEEFIDTLIAEYHRKELMSDSNDINVPVSEIIEDLKWLNNQVIETK